MARSVKKITRFLIQQENDILMHSRRSGVLSRFAEKQVDVIEKWIALMKGFIILPPPMYDEMVAELTKHFIPLDKKL